MTNGVAIASGNYHALAMIPFSNQLQLQLTAAGLVITWQGTGVLQWAPSISGPFADVTAQGNCFTNLDMSAPAKFFRLKR